MRRVACLFASVMLVACASAPPAPPAHATEEHEPADAGAQTAAQAEPVLMLDAPERSRAPSTQTYEQATSTPESLDVNDERVHLTDGQLMGPMRSVMNGCPAPNNAKVKIKTAVQHGRAIGVSVEVHFEHGKAPPKRPPPPATLRYEAKVSAKIVKCVDHAVRALVWPPSSRRDSFTTEF